MLADIPVDWGVGALQVTLLIHISDLKLLQPLSKLSDNN